MIYSRFCGERRGPPSVALWNYSPPPSKFRHSVVSRSSVSTSTLMCDIRFLNHERHSTGPRAKSARTLGRHRYARRPPPGCSNRLGSLVLGVAQGAFEHFLQQPRVALRLVTQQVERFVGMLAANQRRQRTHLARAGCGRIGESARYAMIVPFRPVVSSGFRNLAARTGVDRA